MLRRILVVDDEKFIRMGIARMIEHARPGQYEVLSAKNGAEALEIIEKRYCDMVLTDISMPFMDGMEFIRQLSHCKPKPVVVIISGYDRFSYAVEGIRNGVVDYLLKPISPEDIQKLLDKYGDDLSSAGTVAGAHERELLLSDFCRSILDDELTDSYARQVTVRVQSFLASESLYAMCLRLQSAFVRSRLEERLKMQLGERYLLTEPVGKWVYCILPQPPLFLQELGPESIFYAGMASFERGSPMFRSLPDACRECKERAKRAFLTERLLCDVPADGCISPKSLATTEICYRFTRGSIEQFRQAYEKVWSPETRACVSGSGFTELHRELLRFVAREAPDVAARYRPLAEKLDDPFAFQGWYDFKQELFGYTYLLMNAIREGGRGEYTQPVREAIKYIEANFGKDINLAMVANAVEANYSVLSHVFAEQVGDSFVNYLKRCRIDEARRLLLSTNMPSSEIGVKIGFRSDRQYVKVFKDIVGITPREFRDMHGRTT